MLKYWQGLSVLRCDMLIRDKDKQTLLRIFAKLELPIEIWAYGSRVKGTAHEASDIDLVIRTNDLQPLPIDIYQQLVEDIKESNIPVLVELRDWARLPESFHRQIEQHYEVLFSNTKDNNKQEI
jgi:predicted nucleotidyltransferase